MCVLLAVLALPVLLAAAPAASAATATDRLRLERLGDFRFPVGVSQAPGDPERTYVVEQQGRVWLVRDGRRLRRPFLDVLEDVRCCGERGLFSIAFAPDYALSGLFYFVYTDHRGDIRLEEGRRSLGDAERADPTSRRLLLRIEHRASGLHNGGGLLFGPDGYLYLSTGDGGGFGDPFENGQNRSALLAKILRIDPRPARDAPYRIPPDNPLVGEPFARPEVYAYGLRNAWRFSFDRLTGDFTVADVGQREVEEVNFVPRSQGAGAGANFGWDVFEGSRPFEPGDAPGAVMPVIEKLHDDDWCAIVGGYVVRTRALPGLYGRYLYGDWCRGELWSARLTARGAFEDAPTGLTVRLLTSFGEGNGGCLFATSQSGPVYRLLPRMGDPACRDPAPAASLVAARRQRVRPRRGLSAALRCAQECTAEIGGTLSAGRRAFELGRVRVRVRRRGGRSPVDVPLPRAARAALRRAGRGRAELVALVRGKRGAGVERRTVALGS